MRPENGAQPDNPTATPAGTVAPVGAAGGASDPAGAGRKVPISEVAVAFEDWDEAPISDNELADLFMSLEKAIRARRLYQENNPVYQQFVAASRAAVARLWDRLPSLTVSVDENAFHGFGKDFPSKEGREGLPFLFYRDGVRVLTFLPGFEDEIDRFLDLIDRARQMGPRASDDIVTLLWEEEFSAFQYSYIDLLAEGASIQPDRAHQPPAVERQRLERVVQGQEPEPVPPAVEAGQPPVPQLVSMSDFNETTYFLESEEVDQLYREVEAEWNREVRGAVLDALFDRLEDESLEDRHVEILRILGQLLPAFLARGDLSNVSKILIEVNTIADSPTVGAEARQEIDQLLRELNEAQVLSQFLGSLEDGTINPSDEDLSNFLSYLGAEALPLLIRTAEKTESTRLRDRMAPALDGVGHKHARALAALIASSDEMVALGSARIAGRIRLRAAANNLIALFGKSEADGRRVAIEALASLGDASALDAIQEALDDEDREVRIAAARGLGSVKSAAARDRLKAIIRSRILRDADLTEKMAVYEAFGGVAHDEDIGVLDKILNGRRLMGRESPETRACAALALGMVAKPEARSALMAAARDPHPIVRNAVSKALSQRRVG
jgi:HEAT repeats